MTDMMRMMAGTGTTGTLTMKMLTEEIISKFLKIPKLTSGTIKIMMSTVTTGVEGVVGPKRSSEGARVLDRNMIGEGRVNQRKMVTRILTPDLALHTTGTGEDVVGEGVEVISPEGIQGLHPQPDPKEGKTLGTVPLKAAGEIPDAIPLPVLTTAGQIPLLDTPECSGGTLPLPGGAGVR